MAQHAGVQVVLQLLHDVAQNVSHKQQQSVWLDLRVVPVYVSELTLLSLIIYTIVRRFFTSKSSDHDESSVATNLGNLSLLQKFKNHIKSIGGPIIFAFRILRLAACIVFLGVSLPGLLSARNDSEKGKESLVVYSATVATASYTTLLSLLILILPSQTLTRTLSFHLTLILFSTSLVYGWRDLWPLATYNRSPLDLPTEGSTRLWILVTSIFIGGVFVPLFSPRQYIPVDPKDPAPEPNPEQITPIISLFTYSFLDSLIYKANRSADHITVDQLPPLADYDYGKNLCKASFPHLDPFSGAAKNRHVFWGLIRTFGSSWFWQAVAIGSAGIVEIISPIGMNRLLKYLEDGGEGATIRPWFWIFLLFIGPYSMAMCFQWYYFLGSRTLIRAQAIITQLIFEHALRIRLKAEVDNESKSTSASGSVTTSTAVSEANSDEEDGSSTIATTDENGGGITRETTAVSIGETDTSTVHDSEASSDAGSINGNGKGKSKDKKGEAKKGEKEKEKDEGDSSKSKNVIGKINNLVTTDLQQIVSGKEFLWLVAYAPVQITVDIVFLYILLGWSSLVGLAIMIALIPVPAQFAKLFHGLQQKRMKASDSRVQASTEVLNMLRMVKLFAWERRVEKQIEEKRETELHLIWKRKVIMLLMNIVNHVIPLVHMIVTYAVYTVVMKQQLSASIVFSSMTVFGLLRDQFFNFMHQVPTLIQSKVSLDRVNEFLTQTELLDVYIEKSPVSTALTSSAEHASDIGFNAASFSWSNTEDGTLTPSRQHFRLKIDGKLVFHKGGINLIVGPTGSGKTSLLMSLLGEMHYIPIAPGAWFNLPREGGVAYAAQESWVQNETIRDNILFGAPFDEERYNKVIYQCALKRDLGMFDAGDRTEVGEKGLTLSGGQKARLTLARAVYSSADILLLDDVLAALDVHTSRWIVDKCFKGDLIRGRTVLLVTHNVAIASPIASFVVTLSTDGRIKSSGSVKEAMAKDSTFRKELAEEKAVLAKAADEVDGDVDENATKPSGQDSAASGKLIVDEEVAVGQVSWASMKLFLRPMGGKWPVFFWSLLLGSFIVSEFATIGQTWWLGQWGEAYTGHKADDVKISYYLLIYIAFSLVDIGAYAVAMLANAYGSIRASRVLHQELLNSVLGTTLRFLDKTPTSRIVTRCTQDIASVDGTISMLFLYVLQITLEVLTRLFAVTLITPVFVFPGILLAIVGGWIGRVYMTAQLPVKREMSKEKAPVIGHFAGAISGLTSIRAYGAEESFKKESLKRIDRYSRTARPFYNLNLWVAVRIDLLGNLFAAALAAWMVYISRVGNSATVGFSINMAVGFSSVILHWVRIFNMLEVEGNSLERIQQYLKIEQEPKNNEGGRVPPPAYWPASGELTVEKLSAKYSEDGPKVLHDISFHIKSGQRIGIVGRTGSGKSSLTLSLLRGIITEGEVYYDGIPTSSLNLDALRSNITIIPQVPELLSGTLRHNLDPFEQYDDATLNDVLRTSGLHSIQGETDEVRLTLDTAISSGGGNLSVGQRQIIALARAMLRQSKVLILDEATSAIDYETDAVIQNSLRNEFKDVTLITIAHRLQTIMDADKIMVLDAGRIVEFDTPAELLKVKHGLLRALVDESSDRDVLLGMAKEKKHEHQRHEHSVHGHGHAHA